MRCSDDFLWWAALFAIANDVDTRSCSCNCKEREYDAFRPEPDDATLAAAAAAHSKRRARLRLAWIVGVLAILAIMVIRSRASDPAPAPIQPTNADVVSAPDASPKPVALPTTQPLEAVEVAAATPAPVVADEPLPLLAATAIDAAAPLLAVMPTPEPAAVMSAFFGVESSRADVIAAQGSAPTYSAHHDRTLWWGSSRVEFDAAGNVRSWVDGTPALHVR